MSEIHEIVRRQFDSQASNFSNWSVTRNEEYQRAYFDFCEITPQDTLLDIACGTGEYALFAAPRVRYVQGVDISRGMIEIAQEQAAKRDINNVSFLCNPVERTPLEDGAFSIVICRSAFHHFYDYPGIFSEMIRCCRRGGRISVQDIVAYPDEKIDEFFERFERLVDVSHHRTLSKGFIEGLYDEGGVKINRKFEIEIELNFREYLGHAKQKEKEKRGIGDLIEAGLKDKDISSYFVVKEGILFFRRTVFLVLGEKQDR